MKNIIYITIFFCQLSAFATTEPAYQTISNKFKTTSVHEIKNMPPIRSQDGLGLCYGFSSTTLLNHLYCQENALDCSKMQNALSSLDVSSFYQYRQRQVNIGGYPAAILSNIKYEKQTRQTTIKKESCLPYDRLANRLSKDPLTAQSSAYDKLNIIYNKRNKSDFENLKTCYAKQINDILPIGKSLDDIIKAFEALSFEEFLYDLVDADCGEENQVKVPEYNIGSMQARRDKLTKQSVLKKLETLLLNDIPVGLNFCAGAAFDPKDSDSCSGHAIVLSGIKEVCDSKNNCQTLLKVHNSYGQGWQNVHDNGWVLADNLIERSIKQDFTNSLIWISKYKSDNEIPHRTLSRKIPIDQLPAKNVQSGPPKEIDQSRGPIYRCSGGKITTKWIEGRDCVLDQYMR